MDGSKIITKSLLSFGEFADNDKYAILVLWYLVNLYKYLGKYSKVYFYPQNIDTETFYGDYTDIDSDAQ